MQRPDQVMQVDTEIFEEALDFLTAMFNGQDKIVNTAQVTPPVS